jgi:phosphatidylserine decarboxylase
VSLFDTIRLVVAPPHRAGHVFIGIGAGIAFVGLFVGAWLFWLGLAFVAFCLFFFRDPERVPPADRHAVLAPADGRVIMVSPAVPPPELGMGETPRWRVSIFLSVLNVHVNRVPVDGTIVRIAYRPGKFLNAALDKASADNERNALSIRLADGREIAVVQIAGLIARRILCEVREGEHVNAGARFGIIRFGSRTDLYLPEGVMPLVAEGQTMIGGETVLARLEAA